MTSIYNYFKETSKKYWEGLKNEVQLTIFQLEPRHWFKQGIITGTDYYSEEWILHILHISVLGWVCSEKFLRLKS